MGAGGNTDRFPVSPSLPRTFSAEERHIVGQLHGVEILLEADARLTLEIDLAFEHGVLVDAGEVTLDGTGVAKDHLVYLPVGRSSLSLVAGAERVRLLLIGGEPLGEQILIWWNFVGRSHEEIVSYRTQWQAEMGAADGDLVDPRFGTFPAGEPAPIPPPILPTVRLRPRSQSLGARCSCTR